MNPSELLQERDLARTVGDYGRADEIREELSLEGYRVLDGPDGSYCVAVDLRRKVICSCGRVFRTYHPTQRTCSNSLGCLFLREKMV